jgi:hypothetical protein
MLRVVMSRCALGRWVVEKKTRCMRESRTVEAKRSPPHRSERSPPRARTGGLPAARSRTAHGIECRSSRTTQRCAVVITVDGALYVGAKVGADQGAVDSARNRRCTKVVDDLPQSIDRWTLVSTGRWSQLPSGATPGGALRRRRARHVRGRDGVYVHRARRPVDPSPERRTVCSPRSTVADGRRPAGLRRHDPF